jgi:hypothetical protein
MQEYHVDEGDVGGPHRSEVRISAESPLMLSLAPHRRRLAASSSTLELKNDDFTGIGGNTPVTAMRQSISNFEIATSTYRVAMSGRHASLEGVASLAQKAADGG